MGREINERLLIGKRLSCLLRLVAVKVTVCTLEPVKVTVCALEPFGDLQMHVRLER